MLIEDVLRVEELPPGKFERVVRVAGRTDIYELRVVVDIYREFFQPKRGGLIAFALGQDPSRRQEIYDPGDEYNREPFCSWPYVTFGKIFELSEVDAATAFPYKPRVHLFRRTTDESSGKEAEPRAIVRRRERLLLHARKPLKLRSVVKTQHAKLVFECCELL